MVRYIPDMFILCVGSGIPLLLNGSLYSRYVYTMRRKWDPILANRNIQAVPSHPHYQLQFPGARLSELLSAMLLVVFFDQVRVICVVAGSFRICK